MIEEVLAGLNAAGFDLDADEFADTLWLAAYRTFPGRTLGDREVPEPPVAAVKSPKNIANNQPEKPPPSPSASDLPPPQSPSASDLPPPLDKIEPETPTGGLTDGEATLHAATAMPAMGAEFAKALSLRAPAAGGLPGALDLARALRPLRRRVPAKIATVLDEEETVRKIVEQDLWIASMRPALARWLELAIVVDSNPSMLVWQSTLRELRLLFERLGAFRDVRLWTIETATADRVVLHTRDSPAARDTKELRESSGRRAIVVVSDCIAPAWDVAFPQVLEDWAHHQPVAILQLFPERLWRQTALAATHRVRLRAPAAGVANANLRATFEPGPPGWRRPSAAPIPVLTTEPSVLRAWAGLVAHGGESSVPAVVFEPGEEASGELDVSPKLTPEQRVTAFQSNASTTAFKLASLLAAAPLQLPVMRLVQQALLPSSRQVHLAEVFVSGLLERVTPAGEVRDPDLIEFAFHRGVDDLLLGANRAWEAMAVLEAVSQYVNDRFGRTLDFQALIQDPQLIGDLPVVAGARPFATVTAKVLARFGGKYAEAAKKLRGVVQSEPGKVEAPAPQEGSPKPGAEKPFTGKWILWVDDHPERNIVEHAWLKGQGAQCVNTRNTTEGMSALASQRFDAIITDLARDKEPFAGFDLLKEVRAQEDAPPVAIYTSKRALVHEREALSRGALILSDSFTKIREALARYFVSGAEPPESTANPYLSPEQTRRMREILLPMPLIAEFREEMLRDPHNPGWRIFWKEAKSRTVLADLACNFIANVFGNGCVSFWSVAEKGTSLKVEASFIGEQTLRKDAAKAVWLTRAAEENKSVYYANLGAALRRTNAVLGSRSALGVPVARSPEDRALAVLGLESRNMGAFPARQQEWLEALARSLAEVWQDLQEETAAGLHNLAELYRSMGDYAKAEPLYQRALKINEKVLGPDHPDTATALNNLAELYRSMGDYAKAEPLYQRALKIREKVLGPDHPETATALNNLAELYRSMGDYAKAEPLYQRALKINEKVLGPDHPDTARILNNLAGLYRSLGDYAKAEPLCQRALKIDEKVLGPDHPETATALNNLAELYRSMGDYAKAEPLYQRALKINEKALGPDHPDTARILNNLAELCRFMGDYAKAEPLYQRALKIDEKVLGPDHPDTARILNNLAGLYRSLGDYAKAEPLLQRALEINEKALGLHHPDTAQVLNSLATLKIDLGKAKDAIPLGTRARQAEEKYLSNILSFTSEQQRLIFQQRTRPYTLLATLGSAAELAQTVLRQKGVVLDSLLEDRLVAEASADPRQREIISQLRDAKQRLMQLVLEDLKDLSEAAQKQRMAEKEELSTEVEQLEAGLARQVAGLGKARRALSITVPQVQSVLPKQAVLIELLRYSHYLGKGKSEKRYGAVVISPRGETEWVPVGTAAEIEQDIKLYQKSVRGETDEPTLRYVLKALQKRVWAPIENALPTESTTVIVSPDGELSFVSFATLLTPDDRFLGEKYYIRYVASGRDLLRESKPSGNRMTVIFANPDFDRPAITQATGSSVALRERERGDLQGTRLPALPGTADEAAVLAKWAGKAVKVFLGSDATEAELSQLSSPRVLHLATHGFFLPEVELGKQAGPLHQPSEIPKRKLENPMHRSGLALAGAQWTLDAWGRGEVPPIENDGIVTAEEVGGLKLNGTWLVVLSASDTGSGEARAGEGVMGLRRGFIQAGAQNLLMTLWPISDKATVQIMLDFYEAAESSHNAPEALAEVQRTWLVKLRKESSLRAAVRLAGPFIMSSQGKP